MSSLQQPALNRPAEAAAILRSLSGLAKRLLSRLPPHEMEDLRVLWQQLCALRPLIEDSTAAPALLSNAPARGALLGVLAVALRAPLPRAGSDASKDLNWAYRSASEAASICCNKLMGQSLLAAKKVGFALRLLRTQPLQCCARRLAAPTAALLSLERKGPQQGPQEQPRRAAATSKAAQAANRSQLTKDARSALWLSLSLIQGLSLASYPGAEEADALPQAELAQLRSEFSAALRDSGVLEHAARTLLLLLVSNTRHPRDDDGNFLDAFMALSAVLDCLAGHLGSDELAAPATNELAARAAALRGVMSGRCVQHAVLVSGVAALCAADGGPSYGLPGELLQRVPLVGLSTGPGGAPKRFNLRMASGRQVLNFGTLKSMAWALGSGDRIVPRHGALALLLRVGRLAVASGRSHLGVGRGRVGQAAVRTAVRHERGSSGSTGASAGASGNGDRDGSSGSGSGGGSSSSSRCSGSRGLQQERAAVVPEQQQPPSVPRLELVLDVDALQPLFSGALDTAMALCFPAGSADTPRRAAARVECWRLYDGYTRDVLPLRLWDYISASPVRHLADPGRLMPGALLPDSPPPSWEPALAGGWLPCLERLLRRGSGDPGVQVPVLAFSALVLQERTDVIDCPLAWRHLAVLLAYGEPRQAAALVATLGKLLRGADPAGLADAALTGYAAPAAAALWTLIGTYTQKTAAPDTSEARGLPCEAPSVAGRQLAVMLTYSVCEWLPPLARLAARAMQAAARYGTAGQRRAPAVAEGAARGDAVKAAGALLHPLLVWLPSLLPRCSAAARGAAAARMGAAVAGGGGGGNGLGVDGCGGWRQLLLEEVGAVQLLGAALHMFAAAAPTDLPLSLRICLVRACCALVVAFPQEVRAAAGPGDPPEREPAAASGTAGGQASTRSGLGEQPAGATPALGRSGAAAASQQCFPWRPHLLRVLTEDVRADGLGAIEECAEALAVILQLWEAGGEAAGEAVAPQAAAEEGALTLPEAWQCLECAAGCGDEGVQQLASALVSVAEARGVLRTCSHPGCVSLAGDSEAEAEAGLLVCGRCGAARYCCADCQAAHWRAGHKKACVPRG
ncbi:hypothetical protein TSOC_001222 [Tetrabaena socialis]|uniref:phytol kinase n=1 Tax=Tetrabaena socialis TaxID=47790 RepID=A0A2J8AHB8_9CHLO|nr:hypothetical protein TSOC_001222 [Tetrabaena socialis]|eukprot:PNH11909.1 hypothetical protein TSOC_001222 [Tetrabaena socialis]